MSPGKLPRHIDECKCADGSALQWRFDAVLSTG
jgi:hypothetical protein